MHLAMDQVPADSLKRQLDVFIDEINLLINKCQTEYSSIDGTSKLCRKLIAEKKFLLTLANRQELKEVNLKSSNLRHLKAIVDQIGNLDNVISVLKVFKDKSHNVLHVDIVCDSGYTWCKAVARNAQSLHLIWKGEGQFGEKNINNQIEEYIKFAQCNTHNYQVPKLLFYFAGGVTQELTDYLKSREIAVKGEIVELDEITKSKLNDAYSSSEDDEDNDNENDTVISKNAQKTQFDTEYPDDNETNDALSPEYYNNNNDKENIKEITKINLDVTTMIALVSEMTNGGENFPYKQQFLQRQAEWERAQSLNPILEDFMKGKELFICNTAYNDLMKIVNTVGGEKERERTRNLLKRIQIIPDNPTTRAMELKESSKIKPRAKIIFGTGDRMEAVTMTSNVGFVRSAEQQNVKFSVYLHESPPLTIERFLKRIQVDKRQQL